MTPTKLSELSSREDAYDLLKPLKVAELKEIAKVNHVYIQRCNKAQIIEKIVESTVGARLKFEAIRSIDLKR